MKSASEDKSGRPVYVGFANAKLPDSDYRVAYARDSEVADVYLALPAKPRALAPSKYIRFPVGEGLRPSTFIALARIPFILRRSRADIAHFFATQLALSGPLLARLSGVRSIITITGLGRSFDRRGALGWLLRILYLGCFRLAAASSEAILFQNEDDFLRLAERASTGTRRKFQMIGSAIDGTLFEPARAESTGLPICAMVARVHPSKGIADFLTLAKNLQGRASFVLVGPPSAAAGELVAAVDRAHAEELIRYEGLQEDWKVRELLGRTAVHVIASRGEGIPRVVLEASLSGAATIGYDIAGCRATLPTEAIASAFDLSELEYLVKRALGDEKFRSYLATESLAIATERFSAQSYASKLDAIVSIALTR